MIMRSIRNKKQALKIPMIIFTAILSISLVGFFAYTPLQFDNPQTNNHYTEAQGRIEQIQKLELGLKIEPENKHLWASLGNRLYDLSLFYAAHDDLEKANKYITEATAPYLKALEIDPTMIEVRVDLGTAFFYAGQYDLAEEHFKKAVSDEPTFINGLVNYGVFLYNVREDADAALVQWKAALDLKPDPALAASIEEMINRVSSQNS